MKSLLTRILALTALTTLSACASPAFPPVMGPGMTPGMNMPLNGPTNFNRFSVPMNRMDAGINRQNFPYGLGMRLDGAQPMRDDGQEFSLQSNRPEQVDLRAGFSPVYNQGRTEACVGFSTVGGLGEYFARKRGWNMRFSPRYLWTMGRKLEGTLDKNTGMMISDAQKIMDAYGMLPEQSYPFPLLDPEQNPTLFQQMLSERPSNEQISAAKKFRISQSWKTIPTVSAMRTALADGRPVVFGMAIFQSIANTGPDGMIPDPGPNDKFLGGHAVVAVGYDNARRVFIIRNSWGANWGDHGYGYLSYDFFRSILNVAPAYAGFTIK